MTRATDLVKSDLISAYTSPRTQTNTDESRQSKEICARRGCKNRPTQTMEVAYLRKKGRFCESCAKELLIDELVHPANISCKVSDRTNIHDKRKVVREVGRP